MVADDDKKAHRRWGPTGVPSSLLAEDEKPRLESRDRNYLEDELRQRCVTADAGFYDAVQHALALYLNSKSIHKSAPRPKEIRENVNRAHKAASRLNTLISGLDIHSRILLGETCPGGHDELRSHILHVQQLTERLSATHAMVLEYPNHRLINYPRAYCAAAVAEAFRRHTNAAPTTTRDGPFAVVMEILLTEILGEPQPMSPDALKRALEVKWIERDDGVIEIHPPES